MATRGLSHIVFYTLHHAKLQKLGHKVCNVYEFPPRYTKYLATWPICMQAHNHPGKSYTRIEPEYNLYHLVIICKQK